MNPEKLNKYLYIEKTPTWLVRVFYGLGLVFWSLVLYGFSGALFIDPFFRWFVTPLLFFFTIYHFCTYGLSMCYKQHNLSEHHILVNSFWNKQKEPSIDIFLPICGEDMDVLRNTWKYVSFLEYKNKKVYVLEDSKEHREEHRLLAEKYGFTYFARPNRGEMKKAGNLKYAYERTNGEFIVIFDADFAPRHDFLRELLPYMSDTKVGIVQSPQYFEQTKEVHQRSPLEYGGGASTGSVLSFY